MKKLFTIVICLVIFGVAGCSDFSKSSISLTSIESSVSSKVEPSSSSSKAISSSTITSTKADSEKLFTLLNKYSVYEYEDVLNSNMPIKQPESPKYNSFVDLKNRLPEPKNPITSRDQLVEAFDYYAFYGVKEFTLEISYDHGSGLDEINYLFWRSSLVPTNAGMDAYFVGDTMHCQLKFYDYSSYDFPIGGAPSKVIEFPYQTPKRSADFNDFNYTKREDMIDVWNSEQLGYALMKGFNVNAIPGSNAELILNKAKEILRNIINDDMNEKQKVQYITKWLVENVVYDNTGDLFAALSLDKTNEPDMFASLLYSFHVEGPLLSGKGVCHGYAKTASLLFSMEGILNQRVVGNYGLTNNYPNHSSIQDTGEGYEYSNHGYTYVYADGAWYLNDPTYSFGGYLYGYSFHRTIGALLSSEMQLAEYGGGRNYDGTYAIPLNDPYRDILNADSFYNYYDEYKYTIGEDTFDLHIDSVAEARLLTKYIEEYLQNYQYGDMFSFTIYISNASIGQNIYDVLTSSSYFDVNTYPYYFFSSITTANYFLICKTY